jgi:F-type H+-transporting ATPase subunit b
MHIDWWTLALQTVNVLVLIWILARYFFRPVADIVAKRQEEADRLLADSATARREATEVRAELERAHAAIGAERQRLIAEAEKLAQQQKDNVLTQASEEIARMRSEAKSAIAQDGLAAQQALISRASELSVEIAKRLLMRLPPEVGLSTFVAGLRQELQVLPPEARQSLSSGTGADSTVEVVTAAQLSTEETAYVRTALQDAFGSKTSIAFRNDPSVIAGIELWGRDVIVRNSWRADLDRMREELSSAEHSRET